MHENPFTIIFGIEPQSLIPRDKEFIQITSDFDSSHPTSYAYLITGIRGCGKTVFMTSIQNYYSQKDNWYVLRLNPDLDLFASAISQLNEHIHLKDELFTEINISVAGFGGGAATRSLSDNETVLRKMLKESAKRKQRVLIAIDEVSNTPNIKAFAHSFQAFIGEGLPVFLIMTALPENFNALSGSKNGTFLRRLPKVRLESLNSILVEAKYRDIFSITEETAIELARTVKGYPYAFQVLGAILWESEKKRIGDDVLTKLDAMLYDGSYQAIWEHLTEKERSILQAIAHSKSNSVKDIRDILKMEPNQFSPYREILKENGLINTKTYGRITFCLPRFQEFVLKAEQYLI